MSNDLFSLFLEESLDLIFPNNLDAELSLCIYLSIETEIWDVAKSERQIALAAKNKKSQAKTLKIK